MAALVLPVNVSIQHLLLSDTRNRPLHVCVS